ncbi:MAG: ABC transporter permease [Acidobacteriota bacterium]
MLGRDFRFALRILARNPSFTVVSVILLALGIGANTAIFSVVHAVLLRPLPYDDPHQLVLFWEHFPSAGNIPTSEGGFLEWERRSQEVFAGMAAFRNQRVAWTGKGEPARLDALRITSGLLPLLGAAPLLGRGFADEEDQPGAAPVALLSYGLWQRQFGSDEQVSGQVIQLDGVAHTVIGVLPQQFLFPPPLDLRGSVRETQADIFLPLICDPESRLLRNTYALARLKSGLNPAQADRHLDNVAFDLSEEFPNVNPSGLGVTLLPLHEQGVQQSRTALLVLLGSVALILLIACFNVANLLLARASGRFKEMAIRMAMGASRRSIIGQLLTESLVLAALGSAAGLLVARLSQQALLKLGAGHIPLLQTVSVNATVLLFTLSIAVATGIVFGLAPALQISSPDLNQALKEGSRGTSSGSQRQRLRTALVVAEVALAVVLLVGAGLLLKSFLQLLETDLGFRPGQVLVAQIELPAAHYSRPDQAERFYDRLVADAQSLPGVLHAGLARYLPLSGTSRLIALAIEGKPASTVEEQQARVAHFNWVDNRYLEALQIPLLQGRLFSAQDGPESPPVFLIDQSLARRHWPDGSALGARIATGNAWGQVVGIVGDVKQRGLEERTPLVYAPVAQQPSRSMHLVMRTAQAPEDLIVPLRQRLAALDAGLPVQFRRLDSYLFDAQANRRSPTVLLGIFASLALLLAVVGLYSVLSYLVNQRCQEIGVRVAMGARRSDIVKLISGQMAVLVLTGVLLGLAGAYSLASTLSSLLYAVRPDDPWIYAAVALLFVAVAALAAYLPARRACRVDPLRALRTE